MKVVYVEWLDARGVSGRVSLKDAKGERPLLVYTAGILVREDTEEVVVSQDYWTYVDADGTQPEVVRDIEVIPRTMVQRLTIWNPRVGRNGKTPLSTIES